ncbi:hypothetical protein ACWT_3260 [Actinoplanes sp. SE50]|uniref:hypothetical protein n=1 Tax=unclassified Actinoplanes TaxID=2626549 RepID=UPI00023ECB1B|nr:MULTISPECIES: hypothetical protein [unclassified Actinoplanes]AEV84283.1 hypothetical protein ACPL_3388 [Actinoplanes sp. SE50/110]ATO82675.1 hypothetical protein ACWT_3260 [Actinoplanes sp. SE50]SLM00082.1 hypothetical protein ACSP50_3314 [Actinoplanes sp. SE50/110]
MEFSQVFWYVFMVLLFFGGSIGGVVQHLQSRRHRFKLEMAREHTNLVQAQAKLAEEQNRKTALEVRQAELEIERYDRRVPGSPPIPSLGVTGEER